MYEPRTLPEGNDNQQSSQLEMNRINDGRDYEVMSDERRGTEHPYEVFKQDGPDTTNTWQLLRRTHNKALAFLLVITNLVAIIALIISISSVSQSSGKVDGEWSEWSTWSKCDVTCGNGTQTRIRTCTNPTPLGGGRNCVENWIEMKSCQFVSCSSTVKVKGNWSIWSTWTDCDVTCSNGSRTRFRTCLNPVPQNQDMGPNCAGDWFETMSCRSASCSVNGNWSVWSVWSTWTTCDVTCGNGLQARFRMCSNQAPDGNGHKCAGKWFELTTCRLAFCSVDGGWSEWSTWSKCDVTCGNGTQTRIRTCTNPTPLGGGRSCIQDWNEMMVCQQTSCPHNEQGAGTMVAFTAYGNTVVNSSFIFPTIIMNYGNGYNNSTGQFTCNVAGIYYFAVHVGKTLYSFAESISCSLYLNSVIQLSAAEVPFPNDINNRNGLALSLSGTFYLKRKDTVSVGCSGVDLGERSCSFTGFLVTSGN